MNRENYIQKIQAELAMATAAEVSDAFLSPHINAEFFLKALDEEGPSLWIVNRSDVWNETLELLSKHRLQGISGRALEKIKQRNSKIYTLPPPALPKNFTSITDDSVEDFLGHPMAPFQAILFFARSLVEDHRASAALSFSRRLLEYPPNWFEEKISKSEIMEKMSSLLQDPSPYVRAYAARNPMLESSNIASALKSENNPEVRVRLIQHPATPENSVEEIVLEKSAINADSTLQFVASMDARLSPKARSEALKNRELPEITRCVHLWHLASN